MPCLKVTVTREPLSRDPASSLKGLRIPAQVTASLSERALGFVRGPITTRTEQIAASNACRGVSLPLRHIRPGPQQSTTPMFLPPIFRPDQPPFFTLSLLTSHFSLLTLSPSHLSPLRPPSALEGMKTPAAPTTQRTQVLTYGDFFASIGNFIRNLR